MPVEPTLHTSKRVLLVCGGASDEHSISLISAANVLRQLQANGHEVCIVGIPYSDIRNWRELKEIPVFSSDEHNPRLTGDYGEPFAMDRLTTDFDVAFPILHGPYGEDGTIQGLFASIGLPYVGASVTMSALCMDKRLLKELCAHAEIPQVFHEALHISAFQTVEERQRVLHHIQATFSYPMFVKPTRMGSSIGITRCQQAEDLEPAINLAFECGDYILIEQGLHDFREVECGVLGGSWGSVSEIVGTPPAQRADGTGGAGHDPASRLTAAEQQALVPNLPAEVTNQIIRTAVVSPAGETVHAGGWYDYEAKYFQPVVQNCPADVSPSIQAQCATIANTLWALLEGRGLARFDFFVVGDQVLLNEINTMPGQTAQSLYPALMLSAGVNYRDVIEILLDVALDQASKQTCTP